MKVISQNWSAAAGKTEFSRKKLAETNCHRILFKTLFYLKSGGIDQEWNKNGKRIYHKRKAFLERITVCSDTQIL